MYDHLMIDFETLSADVEKAPALSVGIVVFNLDDEDSYDTLDAEDRGSEVIFDVPSQLKAGRIIDYNTTMWWMNQSNVAKRAVFNEDVKRIHVASWLTDFFSILPKNVGLWGNGSYFDISLLESLAKTFEIAIPKTLFRNVYDLRTLRMLAGKPNLHIPRGVEHNALDDAKYQVLCAKAYWRIIHGPKT